MDFTRDLPALTCALLAGHVSSSVYRYQFILQVRAVSLCFSQCSAQRHQVPLSISNCENLLVKLELQFNFWKAKLLLCVKQ